MTTLLDLKFNADSTSLDKAQDSLKKTAEATKTLSGQQSTLVSELKKSTTEFLALEKSASKVGTSMKDVADSFNPVKLAAGGLAAIIASLSFGALKGMIEGVIGARAELYKLHETTGLSVSTLSGLKNIAIETGTSMEAIATLTTKFNQAVSTSDRPTSLQAEAFKNLGINLKDANGHFKDSITLQLDSARALNEHKDGIEKDAYYMAIWGKQAIQNKDYLKNLGEQTEVTGKITEDAAKKAHELEVNFARLNKATNELKGQIADELIPVLLRATGGLLDYLKAFGGVKGALSDPSLLGADDSAIEKRIASLKKDRDERLTWLKEYNKDTANDPGLKDFDSDLAKAQKLLDLSKARAAAEQSSQRSAFSDTDPRRTDHGEKETLKNIKDKEVSGGTPGPKLFDMTSENVKQSESIVNLAAQLAKYSGIVQATNLDLVNAAEAQGKFRQQTDATGKVTKLAATAADIANLKANATLQDSIQMLVKKAKAEDDAWNAAERFAKGEQDKVSAMRQTVAEQNISREVLKKYGATQDDVNLAIGRYNIAQAETALAIAKASGATEQEVFQLNAKLDALKEIQGLQADQKDGNDAELKRQQSFSAGWEKAFKDYEKNAADASQSAGKVFGSVTSHMSDALATFVTTGKLDFKSLAASLISDLAKIAAEKAIAGIVASMFADGGAFSGGVQMFADGGVVSTPTAFGMSGGRTGVMGEAGPEAIVPLKRGADGKLGIGSSGGAASSQNTTINNNMSVSIGSVNSEADKQKLLAEIGKLVETGTRKTISNEKRPGGMLGTS